MVGCDREYDIGAAWDCGCAFFVRLSMILVGFAFIWACPAGCMLVGIAIGLWIWQVFLGYLAGPIDFTINSRHREMGCVYTLAVYSVS